MGAVVAVIVGGALAGVGWELFILHASGPRGRHAR